MPQQHLDRLTAVDASFLAQEGSNSHMHIGAVILVEGQAPPFEEFIEHIQGRLHLVPRYRQKLAFPPGDSGRPLWVDDPTFNIAYHVRHTALPHPGSEEQLLQLASRIASQQLDRSKPLWEMWIIEGLEDNRFALINKTHHALVDGVSGVDLATVLFDLEKNPPKPGTAVEPWTPHPEPSAAELVAAGLRDAARGVFGLASRALRYAQRPDKALEEVREAVEGVSELAWAGLNPAPPTPLNVEIGPHRRLAVTREQLEDFKTVKNAFGGTVNDVVLTTVSGALRSWLHARGIRTEGLELRALVPVSIRSSSEQGALGNRIAVMRGPLPVYIKDPVARLRFVKQAMDGLKESKQAVGAEVLAGVQQMAPPTILAQASRVNFSTRLFNLIVTNVPGPQFPLYVLGHKMVGLYPIAFLPTNHSLAVAIMSYDGEVNFGLLADYDAMPDVEEITQGISDSLAELVRLANKKGATPERKPPKVDAKKVVKKKAANAKAPKAGKKTSKKKSPEISAATPVAPAKPKAAKPRPVPTTSPVAEDGTHAPSLGLPSSGTPRIATGPAAEMRAARRARRTRSK
ncbi:MAG: wax ester/triacylglycerol synthase family O-acyltransferase [Actinobacteria bacterium]|uniref:diacylglycerol O-acyltransferase n=1 Tax=freshwater metagenome TaxID=449393 RepID=A0A6J7EHY9_9ZZZZ|nr:wax ester/triacylglycerol synthase family O-acyltransferase [Actinomycetota bacterium]